MKTRFLTAAALAVAMAAGSGGAALAATNHHALHHAVHRHAIGQALKVGRSVVLKGAGKAAGESLRLTVAKAAKASVLRNNADVDYTQYAQSGTDFLVVTVHMTAAGKAVPAKNLVLVVKSAKGQVYKVDTAAGVALGSNNFPSTFAPHKAITEGMAFSVPTGTTGLRLYVSLGSGKPVVYTMPKG